MLPNFLIVGAAKCGTTSLRYYISEHKDIFMFPAEIRFFNNDQNNYEKGTAWYERHFENWTGEKAVGEKTPDYFYRPQVPERIARLLPQVKLLFMFRDPVERAYSHYWHTTINEKQWRNFENALRHRLDYINRGRYFEQVERYLEYFPREQMLFLIFEDLKEKPLSVLRQVYEFLGVDPGFVSARVGKSVNVGRSPKGIRLQWILAPFVYRKTLRDTFVGKVAVQIEKLNLRDGYPEMRHEIRRYLRDIYKEDNRRLAELMERDLSRWDR